MIDIQNMSFSYGDKTILKDIDLKEEEPMIIGLWGRNGSGKTTLMKLLSGIEQPDKGLVKIDGIVPYNNSNAMDHITFMQEDHPYSDLWNVGDALKFGQYFNEKWDQKLAEELIEIFDLPLNKKIKNFSKGMKTMVTIIIGLASQSPLTILDEPSNGLDAYTRKKFYDILLDSFEDNPRIIIISTHHIDEVEPLCEKIAVIANHKVLKYEDTEKIKNEGIYLSGSEEAVKSVIGNRKVLEERSLGNQLNVMLDGPVTDEIKDEAKRIDVRVEQAPFQDYLVNLTIKEGEEHAYV